MTDDRAHRIRQIRNQSRAGGERPSGPQQTSAAEDGGSTGEAATPAVADALEAASIRRPDEPAGESALESHPALEDNPELAAALQAINAGRGTQATVDASAIESEPSVDGSVLGEAVDRDDDIYGDETTLIPAAHNDVGTIQVLEFYLDDDRYALGIDQISAIVEMKEITRFPRGPDGIDGVTDLRGEITGVVDPTAMLNVEWSEPSDDHYLVVLNREDDKQKLAIRVTNVSQAVTYHESQIDESGEYAGVTEHEQQFIRGIIKKTSDDATSLVAWLDIDAMLEQID